MIRSRVLRTVFSVLFLMMLSACASSALRDAQEMKPQGPEFNAALHRGYINLSEQAYYSGDRISSYEFARKAEAAGRGEEVAPTSPHSFSQMFLSEGTVREFEQAGARLDNAFWRGAKANTPRHAARAQVSYDCWLYETRSGNSPVRIDDCHRRFEDTMDEIEKSLGAPGTKAQIYQSAPLVVDGGK